MRGIKWPRSYARDQAQDVIVESGDFVSQSFFWLDELTAYEVFLGFTFLNILFFAILFVRLFSKGEWTYY